MFNYTIAVISSYYDSYYRYIIFSLNVLINTIMGYLPFLHLTVGIGDPKATHLRVRFPPSMTSDFGGGGIEN